MAARLATWSSSLVAATTHDDTLLRASASAVTGATAAEETVGVVAPADGADSTVDRDRQTDEAAWTGVDWEVDAGAIRRQPHDAEVCANTAGSATVRGAGTAEGETPVGQE